MSERMTREELDEAREWHGLYDNCGWKCHAKPLVREVDALTAENAALRARAEAAEGALVSRQRYIHAELHVDDQGVPIGRWEQCERPTCGDSQDILNPAAARPDQRAASKGER